MKRLGWVMLVLAGCTEVNGHRNLHRWSSTGTSKRPDVGSIRLGAWGEDGGFLRLTTTDLGNGEFRCKDVPAGEYFAGITDPTGREIKTWIHTDSRVLDLDEFADFDFGQGDGGVIPGSTRTTPVATGGVAPFSRDILIFSPDTASYAASSANPDGGPRNASIVFTGFPAGTSDVVKSWLWQDTSSFDRDDAGVSRMVTSIGGWTMLTGLPSEGELPLQLSLENERTLTAQLPVDAFLEMVPLLTPSVRASSAVLGLNMSPRFAERPERSMDGRTLGLVFNQGPLAQLTSFSNLTLTTHNPFPAEDFHELWSWSLTVSAGTRSQRAGNASYAEGSTTPPSDFTLKMSPPTGLTIDGFDARESRTFASSSPVVSWKAPSSGPPTGYFVELVDGSGLVLRRLLTKSTSVHLPPGFAGFGSIRVRAIISPKLSWDPHPPLDFPFEFILAGTLSAPWSAAP